MILLRDTILKGLLLGLTASLIVTFFDSLFIPISKMYIPYSYPFHVIILNTLLWTTIGGFSGMSVYLCAHRKGAFPEKEDLYWVIFFLIPVTLLYGIVGRLYIPVYIWLVTYGTPVFDHHLSFLWAALLVLFLIAYFNKRKSENYVSSHHFTPELTTIIILLIIKFPFGEQVGREKKMISLCDLYPTILSICGLPIPDDISGIW
jgi:hypothetical protein